MSHNLLLAVLLLLIACEPGPLKQAETLISEGEPDKAIPLIREYLETHPDDHAAWAVLGDAFIQKAYDVAGCYCYSPAAFDLAREGLRYYDKSLEIEFTRWVEDKKALAAGFLAMP
jgi:tetratricopeptide (TPR) repeat protein